MRRAVRITGWKDDKGFGFVTPHDGGSRAFVHIAKQVGVAALWRSGLAAQLTDVLIG